MNKSFTPIEPRVIAVEGMDGAGKSTLIRELMRHYVLKRKIASWAVPKSKYYLRSYLSHLFRNESPVEPRIAMYLSAGGAFKTSRLRNGLTFYDRFIDSHKARFMALGLPRREVDRVYRHHLKPDLTIVLRLPNAKIALERKGGKATAMEKASGKYFKDSPFKTFEAYQQKFQRQLMSLAAGSPDAYLILDGTRPAPELAKAAIAQIDSLITTIPKVKFEQMQRERRLNREKKRAAGKAQQAASEQSTRARGALLQSAMGNSD